jgi:imidazoleglycerol phosphate dehydratase HisB
MENKRVTKREYFSRLIEIVEGVAVDNSAEIVDFLNHEIELLSKKSNVKTKTQKENEVLVERVFDALVAVERPVTVSELQAADAEIGDMSNQKVSALLKKLVDTDRVVKTVDKKKSYFSVKGE